MKKKIIVIDDSPQILHLLRIALEELYDVICFKNPKKALAYVTQTPAAIVMTDIRMPELYGTHVVKHIRQTHPAIQTIIMTGYPSLNLIKEMNEVGASDFLIKPFNIPAMLNVIAQALDRYNRWETLMHDYLLDEGKMTA